MALSAKERRDLSQQIQIFGPISASDAQKFLNIFKNNEPNTTATLADITGFSAGGSSTGFTATRNANGSIVVKSTKGTVTLNPGLSDAILASQGFSAGEIAQIRAVDPLNINPKKDLSGGVLASPGMDTQAELDKIRDEIIATHLAGGSVGGEEAITILMDRMGVPRNDALVLWNDIQPQVQAGIEAGNAQKNGDRKLTDPAPTPLKPGEPDVQDDSYTQYLQRAGLNAYGQGPAGNYLRSLHPRVQALFDAESRFANLTGADPGSYTNYLVNSFPGSASAINTRSGDILKSLFSKTPEQRAAAGQTFDQATAGDVYGSGGRGVISDPVPLELQQSLFRSALIPYWGGVGAEHFAKNLGKNQQQFTLDRSREGRQLETGGFLDYLNKKFNLGRYFDGTA